MITIVLRSFTFIVCLFSILNVFKQINAELVWKATAMNSLNGKTEAMLPEYKKLHNSHLRRNPFFLYNYAAELNVAGKFEESIDILSECQELFNDYDLQMLLADNYEKKGESKKAVQVFQHASNMIPCRFIPLYRIFEIYRENGQNDLAIKYANEIVNKKVKVASSTISFIKAQATEYLNVMGKVKKRHSGQQREPTKNRTDTF
jgi:tetratricopeptide (TPR) repeat protein